MVPFENGAVHDPVPLYVPAIVAVDTVAVPVTFTVQAGSPWTPPAGTSIVQLADVPVCVMATVPVSTTEPSGVRVMA